MLNGKTRFAQFLASPERITTNVLAVRLRQMEEDRLIEKTPYQLKPRRYEYVLTERGRALHGVLKEMCRWANANYPKTWKPPEEFMK